MSVQTLKRMIKASEEADSDDGAESIFDDQMMEENGDEDRATHWAGQERERLLPADCDSPQDRYRLTYWIMFLFGIGSLLPWNMFITAEQYFKKELYDYPGLVKNFENYLIIAAQVPNVTFLFINVCFKHWLRESIRIIVSLCVMLCMFTLTAVLASVNTDSWQLGFFAVTMVSVVIINVAAALVQGGVLGIAGMFPPAYRQAVMSGQGLGGIFAAMASILSLLGSGNKGVLTKAEQETSAIGYFSSAILAICICLVGYIVLQKLSFAQYYTRADPTGLSVHIGKGAKSPPMKGVFRKIWHLAFGVALVFFVTLSIFPALAVSIKPIDRHVDTCNTSSSSGNSSAVGHAANTSWLCTYFTPVTCFLLFNVMDFIGRTSTKWLQKPRSRWVLLPILLRLLFIPLYLFCKFELDQVPTFDSDLAPILLMAFMAVSNGYLGTLCFIYAPSLVDHHEGETAGALMAAFLGLGLLSGTCFSLLLRDVIVGAVV